jgi:PHD/YefM family antitoxin component YafN of YafNO toxin-antitoxin module
MDSSHGLTRCDDVILPQSGIYDREEVVRKRIPLILTRGSRPEAVLILYDDYMRFQQMESEVLMQFDRVWERLAELNAGYAEEEVSSDIETARQE